ncbi:LOW QUALITY PROTEIN: hypothetical protein ACHAXS_000265 [Conticribra weissflogii]
MGVAIDGATHIYGDNMSVEEYLQARVHPKQEKLGSLISYIKRLLWGKSLCHVSLVQKPSRSHDNSIARKQMSISSTKPFA